MFWNRQPQSQLSPDELREKLARSLPISPEDLAQNRQGKLSDSQQAEFAGLMQGNSAFILLMGPLTIVLTAAGIGWKVLTSGEDPRQFNVAEVLNANASFIVLWVSFTLVLYVLLYLYVSWRSSKVNPATMQVRSASGRIKLQVYKSSGIVSAIAAAGGVPTRSIIVHVGRQKIYSGSPAVEDALENGANYHIYYIKTGGVSYFVSAEVEQ